MIRLLAAATTTAAVSTALLAAAAPATADRYHVILHSPHGDTYGVVGEPYDCVTLDEPTVVDWVENRTPHRLVLHRAPDCRNAVAGIDDWEDAGFDEVVWSVEFVED